MANILCRTKGDSTPAGKPRVYFTCHPADFDKYFDKICKDIFATHDCAIFYKEDMRATIDVNNRETDLNSNNLFVIPVTFRLLTEPNCAMDTEIPYALEHHIPILPFMMEQGLDTLYARQDKFGELQYLSPFSSDATQISYEEKLKKHLESVLISDETAKQIRAAFDAYIFLSYRKKDRRYANTLMRLIHAHPECRDVAIWYDEFLTPGESFRQNIEKILANSKLFTLLVTPNLLEEPEGKPNFVMGEEYPAAHNAGIPILPAEMESTDKTILQEKYAGIPPCHEPHSDSFKSRLLESISKVATQANNDPIHTFLIGLAYLDGIDVEVDRTRGVSMVTEAAEAELPEAMKKLYDLYASGDGVAPDYAKAAQWAERLAAYYVKTLGQNDPTTLTARNNLAVAYNTIGKYPEAAEILENVYAARVAVLGENHPDTLSTLSNLSHCLRMVGNFEKALEMQSKAYTGHCESLGEQHPNTIRFLNNLAQIYMTAGRYQKAMALQQIVHAQMEEIFGKEHPDTLTALSNIALLHNKLGAPDKALALDNDVYAKRCNVLGATHPDTLLSLNNLALDHSYLQMFPSAKELNRQSYELYCQVLGENHPTTLNTLNNYAYSYTDLGEYDTALQLMEKAYKSYCQLFGQECYGAMVTINNMAATYQQKGALGNAAQLFEFAYMLSLKLQGDVHPETQTILDNLIAMAEKVGNVQKYALFMEHKYIYLCKTIGQAHSDALFHLGQLVIAYSKAGNWQKCAGLAEMLYNLRCKLLGQEHPHTVVALGNLVFACKQLGDTEKAARLQALYEKLKSKNS